MDCNHRVFFRLFHSTPVGNTPLVLIAALGSRTAEHKGQHGDVLEEYTPQVNGRVSRRNPSGGSATGAALHSYVRCC